ncbi:hypothetical protein GCM10007901_26400 [Dyella acidisoli]|uniref:Uncharacterized protein n=1 Tax=Dyella acidisoli TaxID=1867834 RepID=A0ABQ5XPQ4_9GAMM|nr:hypothetical protein GCM10007901_26400 [Dyella acidisoli]
MRRPGRWRKGRRVEFDEHTFGITDAAEQEQAPNFNIPRVRGVDAVTMRLKRRARGFERFYRPAKVARNKCDFGFGNDAPRASHRLFRTEPTRGASQQRFRSNEIAELCHRDAPKRKAGCIFTQGDPLQGAERITRGECACRSRDQ